MLRILKSSSPIQHSNRSRWFVTIGISAFVFIFLSIFRPFELYEKTSLNPVLASACFSFITFVFVSLMLFGTTKYFSEQLEDRWTIGHELLSSFIVVTCIGIVNHSIMRFIVAPEIFYSYSPFEAFLMTMWMTYAIGFFPISIFFLVSAGISNFHEAKSLRNRGVSEEIIAVETVCSVVMIEQGKESPIELRSDSFLFAKSSGNYVEFYSKDETLRKDLIRITLAKVEGVFLDNEFPALKTHRGFIINTEKVLSYEGNAQGYLLNFGDDLEKVPVSRKQIPDFERVMNG
ncbi:MAG: LytTR family transcriptional regulator DNA-binding domain-containing protein [Crocinitomicaceae bacterium]